MTKDKKKKIAFLRVAERLNVLPHKKKKYLLGGV